MSKSSAIKSILAAFPLCVSSLAGFATEPLPAGGGAIRNEPLGTIAALDVPRYMGTWFEIAKFPNRFQSKCIAATTAEYSIKGDGMLQVTNRCRVEGGAMIEAVGAARQIGPATSPKLEVRFAPLWLSFLPLVWGDYWVIDLDERYQLVAVSEPKREYLWILARTAQVDPKAYQALLDRLLQKGFDLGKLQVTRQD